MNKLELFPGIEVVPLAEHDNSEPTCILTVGVSGSGKSTFAKMMVEKYNYEQVERDQVRKVLYGKDGVNFWSLYKFNKATEDKVTSLVDTLLDSHISLKNNIVISDTNLNSDIRRKLVVRMSSVGYNVVIYECHVSFNQAVKNDLSRLDSVGINVLRKQWKQWLQYLKRYEPEVVDNTHKQKAVIFDIDGTIATMGDRSPFEWKKVHLDTPVPIMQIMIAALANTHIEVLFVSGRSDECKELTRTWLEKNFTLKPSYELHMRPAERLYEKDVIIKTDIYNKYIKPHYDVIAVFDDRPSVVRNWIDLGLTTWAAGDQLIEF